MTCSHRVQVRSYLSICSSLAMLLFFFFFNATPTTEIYTLSLHDALPIYGRFNTSITHAYSIVIGSKHITLNATGGIQGDVLATDRKSGSAGMPRPISYAVFCLKKKNINRHDALGSAATPTAAVHGGAAGAVARPGG